MKQSRAIFRKLACATGWVAVCMIGGVPGALAVTPYVGATSGGTAVNGTTYFNFTTLQPNPVTSATINSAIFATPANDTIVGTGVFNPFLRLQNAGPRGDTGTSCGTNDGCEEGFNTGSKIKGGHQVLDDKPSLWTHALLLSSVPTVTINGQTYRQFYLDINEPNDPTEKFLSLDQFKLFVGSVGDLDKYDFTGEKLTYSGMAGYPTPDPTKDAQKIFDMDMGKNGTGAAVNSTVGLNYDLNAGSGKGIDLVVSVPESAFQNMGSAQYLYLYSKFGTTGKVTKNSPVAGALPLGDYGSSPTGGFEEWSFRACVPEPSTVLLLGGGLLGFLWLRRKQAPARLGEMHLPGCGRVCVSCG